MMLFISLGLVLLGNLIVGMSHILNTYFLANSPNPSEDLDLSQLRIVFAIRFIGGIVNNIGYLFVAFTLGEWAWAWLAK